MIFKELYSNIFIPQIANCYRRGYSLKTFYSDCISGITIGTFAFPLAIAFAIAGGLEPSKGISSAIIGGFIISLLSGCRVQIGGPTGTLAIIIINLVQKYGYEGLCTATCITGILLLVFAVMRLGSLIKFIPDAVTAAYTTAIGILIFTSQIFDFFGIHTKSIPSDFIHKWFQFFSSFSLFHPYTFIIGLLSVSGLFYLNRRFPRFPSTICIVIGIATITAFLPYPLETVGSRFGELSRNSFQFLPLFVWKKVALVFQDAFMMAVLISMESILSSVVSDGMTGGKNHPDCELFSQGVANIFCAFFGGMPVAGSLSRTVTAIKMGARTPLAGIIHTLFIGGFVWLFSPLIKYVPITALAAILILLAWKMGEFKRFLKLIFKAPKADVLVLLVTFTLIIFVDLMAGIETGIVLSTALFIKRMSENEYAVRLTEIFSEPNKGSPDPDAIYKKEVPDQVEVYEINGPFFFGLVERFKDIINRLGPPPKIFILRMRKVTFMDSAALKAISDLHDKCIKQNTILILSGISGQILYDFRHMDLEEKIGKERIFPHIDIALQKAKEILNTEKPQQAVLNPISVDAVPLVSSQEVSQKNLPQ